LRSDARYPTSTASTIVSWSANWLLWHAHDSGRVSHVPPEQPVVPPESQLGGSLILFQVVSIQPSERWTGAMRNSSIRPLKGRRRRSRAQAFLDPEVPGS
jgi:hypothetical protein